MPDGVRFSWLAIRWCHRKRTVAHQFVCQTNTYTGTHARTHKHTLLGYNVASAQPPTAAKSESNILCSPHIAQAWPSAPMEITHHCNFVHASVACLCVCTSVSSVCSLVRLQICVSTYLFISLSVLVWLPASESTRLSACLPCARLLFICLWRSVCRSVREETYTVCPAVPCITACLSACLNACMCLSLLQS